MSRIKALNELTQLSQDMGMYDMKTQHTPEPWHIVEHNWEETGIYPEIGSRLAVCEIDGAVTEETQEHYEGIHVSNARRIVACVNACAGISDNDVDLIAKGGGFQQITASWSAVLREAEQQRDNLMAYAKHRPHCNAAIHGEHYSCTCGLADLRMKIQGYKA